MPMEKQSRIVLFSNARKQKNQIQSVLYSYREKQNKRVLYSIQNGRKRMEGKRDKKEIYLYTPFKERDETKGNNSQRVEIKF